MSSGLPGGGGGGTKTKYCRYYAKDKTCFYGADCQFVHEEPLVGGGNVPGIAAAKGLETGLMETQMLTPGMDGVMSEANLPNSFFSSSFIGINGLGRGATDVKYPQKMPNSQSSLIVLGENAKLYSPSRQDTMSSPVSSLFSSFANMSLTAQHRKTPNPTASEFIPKGVQVPSSRLGTVSQSPAVGSYSAALFNNPMMSTSASFAPGLSLSAGSSPLHSPKITPHASPTPRRHGHVLNHSSFPGTADGLPVGQVVANESPVEAPSLGAVVQNETVRGTTYFYTDPGVNQHPGMVFPSYHVYPSPSPNVAYMQPKANAPSFFMPDELRQDLINRHLLTMSQIDQSENPDIPAEVDNYHSLFPLEPPQTSPMQKSNTFGYTTTCYKAISTKDCMPYCLRRIHGFRLANTKCMALVDMWKKIQHSNIASLREVFTTKAFGEHSLVFAYDFQAGAETLMSKHFSDPNADAFFTKKKWGPTARQPSSLLPESLIWAYVVQLSSALRTIHSVGLGCRVVHPSKILINGKTRLRINCVGIFDVLTFDGHQVNPLARSPQFQQEDLAALGKIVLALACNSIAGIQHDTFHKSMDLVALNYSPDLKNLIVYLLSGQSRPRSINDIMPMIGARFYTQLDAAQMRSDVVEEELAKEVQNGRLFRLLARMGTINERPEFQKDPSWSETGDRYLLKLFRDHLFHQVTETGAPWVDLGHIVHCLNKKCLQRKKFRTYGDIKIELLVSNKQARHSEIHTLL
uniref:PAN2-PAN3 deadenylation complex subunit PAN3 isoform X2 n=1 Tax=Myxine glutinosa TaxID=7769 RepID=UPI0035900674